MDSQKKAESDEQKKSGEEESAKAASQPADAAQTAAEETEGPIDSAEDLKQQLDAQADRYLRLMAEFDNFKKRVSRDYERLVESANERLMNELIEVRENFERGVKAGETSSDAKSIFEGMRMIYTKFDQVLTKNGLEAFATAGEAFDPQLHDALMKVPNDTIPEDHIVEVFEKGYTLKKRVLRHAKVIVSSGKPEEMKG